jgi:hypothetical protein
VVWIFILKPWSDPGLFSKPDPDGVLGITFPMGKKKMAGISADINGLTWY